MSMIQRMTQLIQRGHAEASATINTAASRRQRGASAIEYVIIAAVIAFAIFAAAFGTGEESALTSAFESFFTQLTSIVNSAAVDGGATPDS
ncbi:Flp family type IVb pilin [Halomonas mongoliensis]|uniref:Flp family type IVb pilin n=1 Tax=Halomonas mongoliensis TaxID=321265 RepID=A0ABU1GK65_9GAMM|nr:Flp family type IVb pilin [Halomonas mongoliensis]MDR5892359.1 Flp family type IVb pilin [Halomonas mongoliensis]